MKYVSIAFNALCWAFSIGFVAYGNAALQASFNVGYIFWGSLVVFVVLQCVVLRNDPYGIGQRGSLVSLVTMTLCALVYVGPLERIGVAVGSLVREGLHLYVPLGVVDAAVGLVFAALIAPIAYRSVRDPKPLRENPDPDQAKVDRTGRIARWVTFAVLSVIVAVCSCVPAIRDNMGRIVNLLSSGDINAVVEYLRSFGPLAAAVSASLMVLQSLAAPIPAFIITLSNAVVFGWWQGAILSWSSAMIGAALCFMIARVLGRDAVAHFVTKGALKTVDRFFDKFGAHAILICRLLPFMSFDYVSYAAGLTGMGFWKFFIATGIGQLPATIVYSYVGGTLTGGAQVLMMGLLVGFSAFVLVIIIYQVFKSKNKDLMDEAESADGTA